MSDELLNKAITAARWAICKDAGGAGEGICSDPVCCLPEARVAVAAVYELLRADLAAALERMSKLDFERTAAELERDAAIKERDEARKKAIEECAHYLDGIHHNSTAELLRRALAQPQDGKKEKI